MSRLKPHLQTPATWISLLALFVALGGTAYAAGKITGKNVVNSSLTGADIKNGSIGLSDLSTSAKKSLAGKAGPAGANGKDGTNGAIGANGAAGANGTNGTNGVDGSAVAFGQVAGSTGNCAVSRSRNLAATCTQAVDGFYEVDVTGSIDLSDRVGTCSRRGNGGVPADSVRFCFVRFIDADTVQIEAFLFNSSLGSPRTSHESTNVGIWFAVY